MTKRTCTIGDCARPTVARKMCANHYRYWREYGDPLIADQPMQCANCGIDIPRKGGRPNQCCSKPCSDAQRKRYHEDYWRAKSVEAAERLKATVTKCRFCGESFTPEVTTAEVYCSKLCFNRYRYANAKGRCSVEGCETGVRARGLCWKHYKRWAVASGRMKRAPEPWTEARKAAHQARRARKRGADAEVFESLEIFERDNWVCGICGGHVDPGLVWPDPWSATLDHVVPLSKGGPHTRANTQLAHARCNLSKGNSIDSELDDLTA